MPIDWSSLTRQLIQSAIDEDLRESGDITSAIIDDPSQPVAANLVARAAGIISGLDLAPLICDAFARRLDQPIQFTPQSFDPAPAGPKTAGSESANPESVATAQLPSIVDSTPVSLGQRIATLNGPRAAVLAAERTLLNFLTRMSGVATLTRRFVDAAAAANPAAKVFDTRKTIPGWRELDKYAVRCGGGHNHRTGLYDAILIKDNHLAGVPTGRLAAALFEMLNRAAEQREEPAFVEVEVDTRDQLAQVLKVVGIDIVLLDNFHPAEMTAAVELRDQLGLRGKVELEASGGITLETIGAVAAIGIDRISIGALTHSAPALDLALDF